VHCRWFLRGHRTCWHLSFFSFYCQKGQDGLTALNFIIIILYNIKYYAITGCFFCIFKKCKNHINNFDLYTLSYFEKKTIYIYISKQLFFSWHVAEINLCRNSSESSGLFYIGRKFSMKNFPTKIFTKKTQWFKKTTTIAKKSKYKF
jgi:hypothetical protein